MPSDIHTFSSPLCRSLVILCLGSYLHYHYAETFPHSRRLMKQPTDTHTTSRKGFFFRLHYAEALPYCLGSYLHHHDAEIFSHCRRLMKHPMDISTAFRKVFFVSIMQEPCQTIPRLVTLPNKHSHSSGKLEFRLRLAYNTIHYLYECIIFMLDVQKPCPCAQNTYPISSHPPRNLYSRVREGYNSTHNFHELPFSRFWHRRLVTHASPGS